MFDVCAICGEPIRDGDDRTVFLNFRPVHVWCEREAMEPDRALDYARSYHKHFFEYIHELITSTPESQEQTAALLLLRCFRDEWGGEKEFPDWIADNY